MNADDIKKFCKDNGLTYKELAELIGMTEPSLRTTISNGKISQQIEASINLIKENQQLKKDLAKWEAFKDLIKNIK